MNSFRWRPVWLGVLLAALATVGCERSTNQGETDMDRLAAQLQQSKQAKAAAEQARAAAKSAAKAAPQPAGQAAPRERGRTTVGSATLGEGGGYYSAIAAAHRHIMNRVDELAWIQAVKSYWAEQGHYPKSHEEFMKCLKTYNTELPPLEEGEEYLYDPNEGQFGTLYVVRKEQ